MRRSITFFYYNLLYRLPFIYNLPFISQTNTICNFKLSKMFRTLLLCNLYCKVFRPTTDRCGHDFCSSGGKNIPNFIHFAFTEDMFYGFEKYVEAFWSLVLRRGILTRCVILVMLTYLPVMSHIRNVVVFYWLNSNICNRK